jgi:hypothetical protein
VIDGVAALTVKGYARVLALGFFWLITVDMNHRDHHLALATGLNPR